MINFLHFCWPLHKFAVRGCRGNSRSTVSQTTPRPRRDLHCAVDCACALIQSRTILAFGNLLGVTCRPRCRAAQAAAVGLQAAASISVACPQRCLRQLQGRECFAKHGPVERCFMPHRAPAARNPHAAPATDVRKISSVRISECEAFAGRAVEMQRECQRWRRGWGAITSMRLRDREPRRVASTTKALMPRAATEPSGNSAGLVRANTIEIREFPPLESRFFSQDTSSSKSTQKLEMRGEPK